MVGENLPTETSRIGVLGRRDSWRKSSVGGEARWRRHRAAVRPGPSEVYDPLLDAFSRVRPLRGWLAFSSRSRASWFRWLGSDAQTPSSAGDRSPTGIVAAGDGILTRHFPRDRQRIFAEAAAAALGFDFNRGRLDVAAHPFCTGIGPGDCRITTRYDEHQFADAFFGVLHEVGHGLYEQGLDPAHYGTPLGEAVSLGVHESQSRLWENPVGRSRASRRTGFRWLSGFSTRRLPTCRSTLFTERLTASSLR